MSFKAAVDQSVASADTHSGTSRFRLSRASTRLAVAGLEGCLILACSWLGRLVFQTISGRTVRFDIALGIGCLAAFIFVALAQFQRQYSLPALLEPDFRRVAAIALADLLLLTADLFALKVGDDVSRGFLLVFGFLLLGGTAAGRFAIRAALLPLLSCRRVAGKDAVLIGAADELKRLCSGDLFRSYGIQELARITLPDQAAGSPEGPLRAAAEAVRVARRLRAEELVVATSWARSDQLAALEQGLRLSPLPVRLLPDTRTRSLLARNRRTAEHLQLLDLQRAPMGLGARAIKRLMDIAFALCALIVLSPLLIGTALAVRLDTPGPAIFRQRRNGFDQRTFVIFKFRTMSVQEDHAGILQARRDDPRVTRVGRVLRRTSIDELPQLLNVLRGDMALVGPRPHALAHDELYGAAIDDYCVRHHVKPGITGWAQVNGLRGETRDTARMRMRVDHDLWYIHNWSLTLDLRILLRTCFEVMAHDAY